QISCWVEQRTEMPKCIAALTARVGCGEGAEAAGQELVAGRCAKALNRQERGGFERESYGIQARGWFQNGDLGGGPPAWRQHRRIAHMRVACGKGQGSSRRGAVWSAQRNGD